MKKEMREEQRRAAGADLYRGVMRGRSTDLLFCFTKTNGGKYLHRTRRVGHPTPPVCDKCPSKREQKSWAAPHLSQPPLPIPRPCLFQISLFVPLPFFLRNAIYIT